jgi:lipoprotein-anchoring transpeptidase ErfK/SrfK
MKSVFSRRDFLKLGGMALGSLAFSPFIPGRIDFDDSNVVRIATTELPVRREPTDKSAIYRTLTRDELVHVYEEVAAVEPIHNPVWYRVWGGYIHRGRLQRVRTIFQTPLSSIPEDARILAEVTIPFTMPYRFTKTYGWQSLDEIYSRNPPLYYESVHWIDAVQEGPDGEPWYRIFDELEGGDGKYFIPAIHMRVVPLDLFEPISPDVPWEEKKIEVNLTTQSLTAYEYGRAVFQTTVSTGIPGGGLSGEGGLSTTTPNGKFEINDKYPAKHMGYSYFSSTTKGGLLADSDGYVLPGVPWTSFIALPGKETAGHAFHGTYWHENFGAPMSHGCINMRSSEANWIFRWARPPHNTTSISNHTTRGTQVEIHY